MNVWRRFLERRRIKRSHRQLQAYRSWLEYIASNGAHIPKAERERYNLPDWTA